MVIIPVAVVDVAVPIVVDAVVADFVQVLPEVVFQVFVAEVEARVDDLYDNFRIALRQVPRARQVGRRSREPTIWLIWGKSLGPGTISPCTITMDHNAIICFMTDRLARGPDQDVHVPSVGSQKYPSRGVDVIYS